jgi:hypothetical protein
MYSNECHIGEYDEADRTNQEARDFNLRAACSSETREDSSNPSWKCSKGTWLDEQNSICIFDFVVQGVPEGGWD